jgi:hypothetical protein
MASALQSPNGFRLSETISIYLFVSTRAPSENRNAMKIAYCQSWLVVAFWKATTSPWSNVVSTAVFTRWGCRLFFGQRENFLG